MPNLLRIATKGAEIGFQVGKFAAGQAVSRVQSLIGGGGDDDQVRYAPAQPSAAPKPAAPPKLDTAPAAPPKPRKDITAKPSTAGTKGETTTTVKAAPRTGPRSAGGRISNPKAARKVRARSAGASPKTGAGAGTGQKPGSPTAAARTSDLTKAKGKGGRPATIKAENSPAELAEAKQGRQAAPMGTSEG